MQDNHIRTCTYTRTHDGDTFFARVVLLRALQPRLDPEIGIRIKGWKIAELNEDEGIYMRERLRERLEHAKVITIRAHRMTYYRLECDVYVDGALLVDTLRAQLRQWRRG